MEPFQIDHFIEHGFVHLEGAVSKQLVDECTEILWRDAGCDPGDRSTWSRPVVWLGDYDQPPFVAAANSPALCNAFDALVGRGRWQPRGSLGTFPIRFPSLESSQDTGWHVDASFPGEEPENFMEWRINLRSTGRALLMLFLFSDVSEHDAPTRIRVGSHLEVARILQPAGEKGMSFMELAGALDRTEGLPESSAIGKAGDVYLCHPFLAHAAQAHHGETPRIMGQPPLYPAEPFELERPDEAYSPVEASIRKALSL